MSVFQSELALLPEVIKNIETAKADIGMLKHIFTLYFSINRINLTCVK